MTHKISSLSKPEFLLTKTVQKTPPLLPGHLWVEIFTWVSSNVHKRLDLTCKQFRTLSASTCYRTLRKFFESGGATGHLKALNPEHHAYFNKQFSHLADLALARIDKSKISEGLKVLMASEKETNLSMLSQFLVTRVDLSLDNLRTIYLDDSTPLGRCFGALETFVKESENKKEPPNWKILEELLSQLYALSPLLTSLSKAKACPKILHSLKRLLGATSIDSLKPYPFIVFTKALLEGLSLTAIMGHETYKHFIPSAREFIFSLIDAHQHFYKALPEEQKMDRDITLYGVKRWPTTFAHAPAKFNDDPEILLCALKTNRNGVLKRMSPRLRSDVEFALELLKKDRSAINALSKVVRQDRRVALFFLQGYAESFDEHDISVNATEALTALNFSTLSPEDPTLRSLVLTHPGFLYFASPACRNNKSLVLEAIQINAEKTLAYASDILKDDEDVIRAATAKLAYLLETCASNRLKNTPSFVESLLQMDIPPHQKERLASFLAGLKKRKAEEEEAGREVMKHRRPEQ